MADHVLPQRIPTDRPDENGWAPPDHDVMERVLTP